MTKSVPLRGICPGSSLCLGHPPGSQVTSPKTHEQPKQRTPFHSPLSLTTSSPARCQPLPGTLSTYLPISLGVSLGAQMVKNLLAMQETWVQSLGQEDPLEKGMATHPSISAWRIPWTEEHGQLQSMGSQRVRHNLMTDTCWLESQPFQKAGVCFSQPLL